MSENTKIEWADHTFNPWIGCTKVGPGCDNCYAKADFEDRRHRVVWGAGQARSRTKTWADPVRWNSQHDAFFAAHGRRQRVFCASLADVFDNEAPTEWRMDLFALIANTPNLDWLILTKRIGNVLPMCSGDSLMFDVICERVWLGATIVNQEEADRDIPKLLAVPAAKRFLSMEPLLGPVDIRPWIPVMVPLGAPEMPCRVSPAIDWVIVGGESGPNARPMHPDWARSLRDQCHKAGVPFLFKQWGEFTGSAGIAGLKVKAWDWKKIDHDGKVSPDILTLTPRDAPPIAHVARVGKKAAGRSLDGRIWNEVPS